MSNQKRTSKKVLAVLSVLFGGLGTALVVWFLSYSAKPAIANTSSNNSQVVNGSANTQQHSDDTQTANGGRNTQVINKGPGAQTVYVYPQSSNTEESKKSEPAKPKPKVQHPVEAPAQSGNVVTPNGSIIQNSTAPYSPNIVAGGNVTIGNIPPPDRNITIKKADLAVPVLKESVGTVRVDTVGATGDRDEITRFSALLNTLFTMGDWKVLDGFANGIVMYGTSTGISHGEGVHCYAKNADSAAIKAAMKALEVVGFPCQEGRVPTIFPGEASPDFYIEVGTRLSPQ